MCHSHLHFCEGEWRSFGEEVENLKEKLAKIEFSAPVWIVLTSGPVRNEIVLDSIVLLYVVKKLNDGRILRLI